MKTKLDTGWKLLLLILAVLWASMPAMTLEASDSPDRPDSGTLTIHDYVLEDMEDVGAPGDGNETTNLPADAKPLAGVEFTVWQVDPDEASNVTSASEAWQYVRSDTKKTGATDEDGKLTFNLSKGLYYVAETGNNGTDKVVFCDPFLVSVPMEDSSGSGWITDVHVYPKNQSLVIDKFVGEDGDADYDFTDYDASKYKPVAMNTPFGFSILSSLPANLGTADSESYIVTDALKSYFDYVVGTLKVYAAPTKETPAASAYLLTEGSDYTSNFNEETNTLTVELTASGIARLGNRYTENQDRYLLIKYDCQLNDTADCGVRLYGGAEVVYKRNLSDNASAYNSANTGISLMSLSSCSGTSTASEKSTTSETNTTRSNLLTTAAAGTSSEAYAKVAVEAAVHTGQVGITKLADGTDQLLEGAKFGIAATKADAEAGNFLDTGTTDENGLLSFPGLLYGAPGDSPSENTGNTTYWIVETEAPDGYKLVEEPVEVTFHYQQNQEDEEYYFAELGVYNVLNDSNNISETQTGTKTGTNQTGSFVKTGDTSTLYLFLGILLLSLAVIVIVYRKKKA
ncbi:MAG: SpaH/EbpB family LPXTG-anchored major pilin [Lachnospiraceae bacterium]